MAENEGGGITVPVVIGKKMDVTKKHTHSSVSVLFLNSKGHAHMLPEDMAANQVKSHRGVIVEKSHKDYLKLFKMATGFDDKIGTKKFLQVAGKVSSIEDSSRTPIEELVKTAEIESAKAKKDAEGK
jgi:hypothetical protein